MAIFSMGAVEQDGILQLGCDETSDVQNLPDYVKYKNAKPGSSCYVIDTGEIYLMKSNGTWKKQ